MRCKDDNYSLNRLFRAGSWSTNVVCSDDQSDFENGKVGHDFGAVVHGGVQSSILKPLTLIVLRVQTPHQPEFVW